MNTKATPGSWTKGKSGNPNGRPRKPLWQRKPSTAQTAKDRADRYVIPAFKLLAECVKNKDAPMAARVSAANSILERAYGKAPQDVTVRGQVEHHIIKLIQGLDTRDVIDLDLAPELPAIENGHSGEAQDT